MNSLMNNILQRRQMGQQQQPKMQSQRQVAQQPDQGQAPYNPFDQEIASTLDKARQNLGMTGQQQNSAIQNSLLAFAQAKSQQPRQKGFLQNLRGIGEALNPAMQQYGHDEERALQQNNSVAQQILAQRAQEEARMQAAMDRQWQQQHAEKQFGEQQRHHNQMYGLAQQRMGGDQVGQLMRQRMPTKEEEAKGELSNLLNTAEQKIAELGSSGERGRIGRFLGNNLPGGFNLDKEQAEINALGDILRGKLFNAWGYRNQAEFEHVPTISADNPREVNLAIIQQLRNSLGGIEGQVGMEEEQMSPMEGEGGEIPMFDPQGNPVYVNSMDREQALQEGYTE